MKKIRQGIIFSFFLLLIFFLAQPTLAIWVPQELGPLPKFAPNEFIVKYRLGQTPQELEENVKVRQERVRSFGGILKNLLEDASFRLAGKESPEKILAKLEDLEKDFKIQGQESIFKEARDDSSFNFQNYFLLKTLPGVNVREAVEKYQKSGLVELAEPNYLYRILETPNDPDFPKQWGLPKINTPQGWEISKGENITLAIVDTGVDLNHPDLKNKVVPGYNVLNPSFLPQDDHGHGTHVAGIAAAVTNNSLGVAGVGWQTKIMPIKATNSQGVGYSSWEAAGIKWAADQGAKVINLSLGGLPSSLLANTVAYVLEKGVVIVAAMGNCGPGCPANTCGSINGVEYPAAYPGVIAVGATDQSDQLTCFSSQGSHISVSAPGRGIYSTWIGGYTGASGTSMATPFVSGLAALVLAKNPNFMPAQVKETLEKTAEDLGVPGKDNLYGFGRINACRALGGCGAAVTPTPTPTLPPGTTPTPTPTLTPTPTSPPGVTPTPTPTPTPTAPPTPTPTHQPGQADLEFKIKFQGIDSQKKDQKVKVTLRPQGFTLEKIQGLISEAISPDLVVNQVFLYQEPKPQPTTTFDPGAQMLAWIEIKNIGQEAVPEGVPVKIAVFRNRNLPPTCGDPPDGPPINHTYSRGMAPGESVWFNNYLFPAPQEPGKYKLWVLVDSLCQVAEGEKEINNTLAVDYEVIFKEIISPLPTLSPTPTPTPTPTLSPTPTPSPSLTPTPLPTITPPQTPTPTISPQELVFEVVVKANAQGIYLGKLFNLPPGIYQILIKGPGHLQKNFGSVTLSKDQKTEKDFSSSELLFGDVTGDNQIKMEDLTAIISVWTKSETPVEPQTEIYDHNLSGLLELSDITAILANWTIPEVKGD